MKRYACNPGAMVLALALAGCATTTGATPEGSTPPPSPGATPSVTSACLDSPDITGLIRRWTSKGDDFNTMVAGTLEDLSKHAAEATATYPLVVAAFDDAARYYGKGDAAWTGRYWEKDLLEARDMLANGSASFALAVDLCANS
jgi:hypothetical protein